MRTPADDLITALAAVTDLTDYDQLIELIEQAREIEAGDGDEQAGPRWETVPPDSCRLAVPGGWIYACVANVATGTFGHVFVPSPTEIPAVYREALAIVQALAQHAPVDDGEGGRVLTPTDELADLLEGCRDYV